MSAALLAYLAARKRHKKEKKRREIDAVIEALKDEDDKKEDAAAANALAQEKRREESRKEAKQNEERAGEGFIGRWVRRIFEVIGSTGAQTLQYIVMLYCFQALAATIRIAEEFYLDKHLGSMIVGNAFDDHHRTLVDVRTFDHVYKWMSNTMVPALFHNAAEGQAWPDGDGTFSLLGATPYTVDEMVDDANTFSMPQGITIKQVRIYHFSRASLALPVLPPRAPRAPASPCLCRLSLPLWARVVAGAHGQE